MPKPDAGQRWVLLTYRMPREPSTPRIALWRKLEQLGVARLGDGLVAIPADPRTREQLDWIAEDIRHAGGTASVWLATPADPVQEQALVDTTRAARAEEYREVLAEAGSAAATAGPERTRTLRRLRGQLRRINRRDFFTAPHRDEARTAVEALADEPAATAPPADATRDGAR